MAKSGLSSELIEAGAALLATTDRLAMRAQGAMWLYDHNLGEWRYYLVTSLVDVPGRRKTYKLLIEAFEKLGLPKAMTIDDVHLGSPNDPFFQHMSSIIGVSGSKTTIEFEDSEIGGVRFDGLVYRVLNSPLPFGEINRIEKQFKKKVKDLVEA